jgi:hypothetical protein
LQRTTRVDVDVMFSSHLRRLVATPAHYPTARGRGGALSAHLIFAHPSTSRRYPPCPPFILAQRRSFVASPTPRAPPPNTLPSSPTSPTPAPSPPIHRSFLSRLLPASFSNTSGTSSTSASFRKIVALARPERRPLLTALSLLLVSSSVSLSIPFTVGRLIDYFTSPNPVGWSPSHIFFPARSSYYEAVQICGARLSFWNENKTTDQSLTFSFRSTDNSIQHLTDTSYCGYPPCVYCWWCLQCGTRISYAYVG